MNRPLLTIPLNVMNMLRSVCSCVLGVLFIISCSAQQREVFPEMPNKLRADCHCQKNDSTKFEYFIKISNDDTIIKGNTYYPFYFEKYDYISNPSAFIRIENNTIFYRPNSPLACSDTVLSSLKGSKVHNKGNIFLYSYGSSCQERPFLYLDWDIGYYYISDFGQLYSYFAWVKDFEEINFEWGTDSVFYYGLTPTSLLKKEESFHRNTEVYFSELIISKKRGFLSTEIRDKEGNVCKCVFQEK